MTRHPIDPSELVPFAEHRARILGSVSALDPIELRLLDALGCVAAEEVVADGALPPFASSAMDGYAVAAADAFPGANLRISGEVAAGGDPDVLVGGGYTARIMTGAPIPPGAEAIVPVEQASEDDGVVTLTAGAEPGDHIRPAGEDLPQGAVVIETGRRLTAADVGMAAMAGRATLLVHPRPRVVVITTGDELVDPGSPLGPGQIRDSNGVVLAAMAREAGAESRRHPIVRDDPRALMEAIEGALPEADVLVTSGGVSAGRHDHVKGVLAQLGDVEFSKVGMQPGMPQAFGLIPHRGHVVPAFGLPGNPSSSAVSFEMFVRPALRRMQGRTDLDRPRVTAVLDDELRSPAHKVSFLRVRLQRDGAGWRASMAGPQGSGLLGAMARAHGLAELPPEVTRAGIGDEVLVHVLVEP